RFQLELEFVQCLANPQYLQFLAQQNYFSNPAFLNYLAYLRYWQQPPYAKYITYPYALHILDLLQHPAFRHACASADTSRFVHEKEYWHWRTYR
ncbi:mediator complex, subunit Med31, partial [Powellomyces hirtus]